MFFGLFVYIWGGGGGGGVLMFSVVLSLLLQQETGTEIVRSQGTIGFQKEEEEEEGE